MLKELLTYDQTPERTAEMLSIESLQVLRAFIYKERFGDFGYARTLKTEVADAYTQILLLCEQMGWLPSQLEKEGIERFKERMAQIKEGRQ